MEGCEWGWKKNKHYPALEKETAGEIWKQLCKVVKYEGRETCEKKREIKTNKGKNKTQEWKH